MKNINNISFELSDFGVEFSFTYKSEGYKDAFLQLPTTPDSQHKIDGDDYDCDNEYHVEVFEKLRDYFYADFKDSLCAKASAFLGKRVIHVQKVTVSITDYADDEHGETKEFTRQHTAYVAFCENSEHILKEGGASDYYNVFYFDNFDMPLSDEKEAEIIAEAKRLFFAENESNDSAN